MNVKIYSGIMEQNYVYHVTTNVLHVKTSKIVSLVKKVELMNQFVTVQLDNMMMENSVNFVTENAILVKIVQIIVLLVLKKDFHYQKYVHVQTNNTKKMIIVTHVHTDVKLV